MRRKKVQEEPENHDRWLVSYADFITLLFAFFVVMYSISSVNEGSYRVLSDSIVSAFNNPKSSLDPIQVGQLVRTTLSMPNTVDEVSEVPRPIMTPLLMEFQDKTTQEKAMGGKGQDENEVNDKQFTEKTLEAAATEVDEMAGHVEDKMEKLIDDDILKVKRNAFWLEVEIKSSLLFPSGSSVLIPESEPVLIQLSDIFVDLPNRIHIEGFTDNKPISTAIFPSNWELSAARASAVVRLFERNGIGPSRMAAIGYGEYRPIADNESDEGRAINRRVVLVVMAALEGRQDERIHEFELLK